MSMALSGPSGRIALGAQVYTLGSEPGNQVVLNDPKVSPRHAVLQRQEQRYSITDLGSFDGTYLNEQRLGPHMPAFLKNGDRLRLGNTLYTYEENQPASAPPPPPLARSAPGYDPTIQAFQAPVAPSFGQAPQQASATPAFGQGTPPVPPYGQTPQPPAAPSFGQSNPALPPSGQAPQPPVTPPFGQSNPALPPYGQAPQPPAAPSFGQANVSAPNYPPYTPPSDPNAATEMFTPVPGQFNASQQPWQQGTPPGYVPPSSAPRKKSGLKMLIIVLVIVLVLGGGAAGGIAFYITHLPQPTLSATSDYKVGSTLAGTNTTTFHLSGHKFSSTSAITFLLDNAPAPGSSATQSDSNGNVTTTLTVTDGWTVGNHIITAKDAGGYVTKAGVSITIVTPGQAKTPGPNGAPTDSASGTIAASIQTSGGSDTVVLNITGNDNGGTVCTDEADGKPHVKTGTSQGVSFVETISSTCSGTYKGGTLTYTETVNSDRIVFTDGIICTLQTPVVARHLEGTFTSATAINGSYSDDGGVITCKLGLVSKNSNVPSSKGTWSGTFKAK